MFVAPKDAGFEMSSVPRPVLKENLSKLFSYDLVALYQVGF